MDRLPARQSVRDIDNGAFGIAVQQQVGAAVQQDGAAHLVAPVIVVGDTPQAGLDTADHQGHVAIGLPQPLAVDDHCPVGAFVALVAGGVGIVVAPFAVGGVAVDHGVHIAGSDAEKQVGPAQHLEGLGAVPLGLGDDPHPEALGLQQATDHRHAETGVVHVGIAGDDNNVAAVPSQGVHLGPGHGQLGRGAKAFGPEFAVGEQGCCHGGDSWGGKRASIIAASGGGRLSTNANTGS